MNDDKNIYQRINEIMKLKLYLKKGSAGQGTGVQYDELISLLAPELANNGIVVTSSKSSLSRCRETSKGTYIFECDFTITYINIDNPEDRFSTFVESHSMDSGDKAPGKAITYATKISMLKVFGIESGDNEESREEQRNINLINAEQVNELYKYLCDDKGFFNSLGAKVCKAYKFKNLNEIKSNKFDEILKVSKNANNK